MSIFANAGRSETPRLVGHRVLDRRRPGVLGGVSVPCVEKHLKQNARDGSADRLRRKELDLAIGC